MVEDSMGSKEETSGIETLKVHTHLTPGGASLVETITSSIAETVSSITNNGEIA